MPISTGFTDLVVFWAQAMYLEGHVKKFLSLCKTYGHFFLGSLTLSFSRDILGIFCITWKHSSDCPIPTPIFFWVHWLCPFLGTDYLYSVSREKIPQSFQNLRPFFPGFPDSIVFKTQIRYLPDHVKKFLSPSKTYAYFYWVHWLSRFWAQAMYLEGHVKKFLSLSKTYGHFFLGSLTLSFSRDRLGIFCVTWKNSSVCPRPTPILF